MLITLNKLEYFFLVYYIELTNLHYTAYLK